MILVWDTETTGMLPKPEKGKPPIPSDDPRQPHLVELALGLFNPDGTEVGVWSRLIRPDGWEIPPEAAAIHGISTERAHAEGIPLVDAVSKFLEAIQGRCTVNVCHNPYFDWKIMRTAMLRSGKDRDLCDRIAKLKPTFDTCRAATKIVNLPPSPKMMARGMFYPKQPKLEECHQFFFGEPFVGHEAQRDVRFTAWLYFKLLELANEQPELQVATAQ